MSPALLRNTSAASLIGLILLGLAWELWLAPLRPGGSWLVLKVLPLLLPLFGILRGKIYTYRWSTLLIWLYFTEGSVRAWTEQGVSRHLAVLEVILALVLFLAAATFARTQGRD
jgi:uncharacterized membrane protein